MMVGALRPYESCLASAQALSLRTVDGQSIRLDIGRYLADCDAADRTVLERCRGPVLDVGCGPGRMAGALAERGIAALGVDIAPVAVELTRARGAVALVRDVFDHLPGEGRWPTALVLDGNVGIGGDVDRLLGRLGQILAADGRVIIETVAQTDRDDRLDMRFAPGGVVTGPEFGWAVIGARALLGRAEAAGLTRFAYWSIQGRCFLELGRGAPGAGEPDRRRD